MRFYSVAIASLTIEAPQKWTDNLLAHHELPEVRSVTRGVARRVSWAGLVRIWLIRELHVRLGCGVREAVALSELVLGSSTGQTPLGRWLSLSIDRVAVESALQRRLAEVRESAPRPRRGRPRLRTPGLPARRE